ncbi:Hypothetical protein R9X50_00481400 [Acrodontium crateriforme]|uniref:Glutamate carboxypeptidase n=1 Tax=Acrodontium crateriforme TaxID=150365 RepID=A0AAQ3M602_9PEZI|nr:Hypothetical protein R9X50_00481400 [Acrodontium crateriforme]
MDNNDQDKYQRYANIPIPTYDEALLSQASSSTNLRGPHEISDDAERQGLLGQSPSTPSAYRPPTVESARTSLDSDLGLPEVSGDGEEARRHIEEMDYMEGPDTSRRSPRPYHRTRLRNKFSQGWNNIWPTLSSIRLPRFRSIYSSLPVDMDSRPSPSSGRFAWITQRWKAFSIPERYRLSAPTVARLCGLFAIILLVYALVALDMFPNRTTMGGIANYDPAKVREFVIDSVDGAAIQGFLYHITSYDHVAGTDGDFFLAKWMESRWRENGMFDEIMIMPYYVYLNFPGERGVEIVRPENQKWTAILEEDPVYPDRQQSKAWHGHSRSGDAEGFLIYANGGSRDDFQYLHDNGISTKGSIALVKYYGTQGDRALKIKAAEEAGCVGVLIYSDPSDVDENSIWMPSADSVQRGGVSLMSWVIGDPLTPGYPSTADAPRVSQDNNAGLPNIPSLPLSWRDAQHLLTSLNGHGLKVRQDWVHGDKDFAKEWFSGNASSSSDSEVPIVHLKNRNDENPLQEILNLHGQIEGLEQADKKIIIGNHRDSWCFGAADPGSGSAVMMEIVRIFGELRKVGWRPLRTIEFASWDAEEYNLVGSTEYVEQHIEYLRTNAYAYINVDVGVAGSNFRAAGSPIWKKALIEVLDRVKDPATNHTSMLLQRWNADKSQLEGLGAGSDYVAFQDMAGTSSIDFGFERHGTETYPYHSCRETFEWMAEFGDPGENFPYHQTLAQFWALLILEMADRPILPYDLRDYADAIKGYIPGLERDAASTYASLTNGGQGTASIADVTEATKFTLSPLHDAAEHFAQNAALFHRFEDTWTANVLSSGGFETPANAYKRLEFNDRLANFETDLLDKDGVPGRTQFKHVIFGPQAWSGYEEAYFPAVRDAISEGRWKDAQIMVERAAARILEASNNLLR